MIPVSPLLIGNSKGFRNCVPEKGPDTKYLFFITKHNIPHLVGKMAVLELLVLFFGANCRINVNLMFLLIIVLETYIRREQDPTSTFFRIS